MVLILTRILRRIQLWCSHSHDCQGVGKFQIRQLLDGVCMYNLWSPNFQENSTVMVTVKIRGGNFPYLVIFARMCESVAIVDCKKSQLLNCPGSPTICRILSQSQWWNWPWQQFFVQNSHVHVSADMFAHILNLPLSVGNFQSLWYVMIIWNDSLLHLAWVRDGLLMTLKACMHCNYITTMCCEV